MSNLVYLKNEEAVCSSVDVAKNFRKRHDNVMRAIEDVLRGLLKIEQTPMLFKKSFYVEEQNGQRYPMYLMNRDGFTLLVMGFTGKKALEWKLRYIKAFNEMEALLREQSTVLYTETRDMGKVTRKAETEVLAQLVSYARAQGSEHPEKLYVSYSRLANHAAGITDRALATTEQIHMVTMFENIILNRIVIGMREGKHYKDIYIDCKEKVALFNMPYLNKVGATNPQK